MERKVFYRNRIAVTFAVALLTLFSAMTAQAEWVVKDYVQSVMAEESLHAYYRFDGDTGVLNSTVHDAAQNFDGAYTGSENALITAAGEGAPIFGISNNKAMNVSILDAYANIGTLGDFGKEMRYGSTLEMWVKSSNQGRVMSPFGAFDSNNHWCVKLNNDPTTSDGLAPGGISDIVFSNQRGGTANNTGVTDGTWTYLAIVHHSADRGIPPEGEEYNSWRDDITVPEGQIYKIYTAKPGDTEVTEVICTDPIGTFTGRGNFQVDHLIGGFLYNGEANDPFFGQIDEVALYLDYLSVEQLNNHLQGRWWGDVPDWLDGDCNKDGVVNAADVTVLAGYWQMTGVGWAEGDFNGDGVVNAADVTLLAGNWQKSIYTEASSASAVPEPSTLVLLLSMGLAWLVYRRK